MDCEVGWGLLQEAPRKIDDERRDETNRVARQSRVCGAEKD